MSEWSENAHFEWIGMNYLQGLAEDELINTIIKKHQTEKHILKNVLFVDDDDAGDNNIKATNLCWTSYQKVNESTRIGFSLKLYWMTRPLCGFFNNNQNTRATSTTYISTQETFDWSSCCSCVSIKCTFHRCACW